jgi:predicted CXXCH cytochrome family protein
MNGWKVTGIIATLVIVLSIPLSFFKERQLRHTTETVLSKPSASFVGSDGCKSCHKREYDLWKTSHHAYAMALASPETVLGNFEDAEYEHFGIHSRFYRKGKRYFVYTQGPDGKMGDFEVTHTFGWYPLQQYLVPFPGGRLQCLPIAWDVPGEKWYHLYPNQPIDPKDWLYWTNAGQNWNGMCAECHSTNLKKNYDVSSASYTTTWSDINVGCEACHGPGSKHVAWAELPEMARPPVANVNLEVKTARLKPREQVELCAPCHSRRAALGDYTHAEPDLLDSLLPQVLSEGLYYVDGQILEEVYVYGSFTQSKMYHREVRCSDCHDVHSAATVKEGNALCLQCHRAEEYDTAAHHFHKKKGEDGEPIRGKDGTVLFAVGTGAECIQCHMPGRLYMGIDYRPDHSLRIPHPDLTLSLGTPNACNRCHREETAQWADETMTKWYGPGRREHYGTLIDAGRKRLDKARKGLILLSQDPLYPVIVRATALNLLGGYPGDPETNQTFERALLDAEALIRRTAAERLPVRDRKKLGRLMVPLLYDPVKAVRIEAARQLAETQDPELRPQQQEEYERALREYVAAMEYSADFAFGRYNLGNLYAAMNRTEEAIRNYLAAITIDNQFYPAKVNLAMLYNRIDENSQAEILLREVIEAFPHLHEVAYSLSLLLAEEKKYAEAALFLERAAEGMPRRARVHYNLGLLLQKVQKDAKAERALRTAIDLEPENMDFLYAMADFYLKRHRFNDARKIAEQMISSHPDQRLGHELMQLIDKQR